MAVSISVPLAADAPELVHPYTSQEEIISDFTPAAKQVLNRIYAGMLAANTTLANGARVDRTSRVFEWMVEQVAAGE